MLGRGMCDMLLPRPTDPTFLQLVISKNGEGLWAREAYFRLQSPLNTCCDIPKEMGPGAKPARNLLYTPWHPQRPCYNKYECQVLRCVPYIYLTI